MTDRDSKSNEVIAVELKTFIVSFIVAVVTIVSAIIGGQIWFLSYVQKEIARHADSGEHRHVAGLYARKDVTELQFNVISEKLKNIEKLVMTKYSDPTKNGF